MIPFFEVLLLAILLLSWQSFYSLDASAEYDLIEFFAGSARIARLGAGLGMKTAAYDILFDTPEYYEGFPASTASSQPEMKTVKLNPTCPMDLTTPAGFTLPGNS